MGTIPHTRTASAKGKAGGHWMFTHLKSLLELDAYKRLGAFQARVLHAIIAHADRDGVARPSTRTLARMCLRTLSGTGVPSRIFRAIKMLEEAGLLRVQRGEGGRANRYHLKKPILRVRMHTPGVNGGRHPGVTRGRTLASTVDATPGVNGGRLNSHSNTQKRTPTRTPTRTTGRSVSSFLGGSGSEDALKPLQALGVKSHRLLEQRLCQRGPTWMRALAALAETRDQPLGFAVWALQNPDEVHGLEDVPVAPHRGYDKRSGAAPIETRKQARERADAQTRKKRRKPSERERAQARYEGDMEMYRSLSRLPRHKNHQHRMDEEPQFYEDPCAEFE